MVSQSTGKQDCPVDPLKEFSNDSGNIEGLSSLLNFHHPCGQSDVKVSRHKAAWINPTYAQQELPDLPALVPTAENSRSYSMQETVSTLYSPLLSLEHTSTKASISKDTVDSMDSSLTLGASKKCSDISLTSLEEQHELPSHCLNMPLSKILATSPHPETGSDFLLPHQMASQDTGAVQVSRRNTSSNSFPLEAFVLPADIEKENAHFYFADMIISTMERIKYNILSQKHTENWNTEESSGLLMNDQAESDVTFSTNIKQNSGSSTSSDSGYEGCAMLQVSPLVEPTTLYETTKENCKCDSNELAIPEFEKFSNANETYGCPYSFSKSLMYMSNFNSPERIAKDLYQVFHKCCMLSAVNCQLAASLSASDSTVVNKEHGFEPNIAVVQDIKLKSRMRETEDWAPPRFQIIFNVHPSPKRDLALVAQDFLCAGCGTPIEPKFVKRLRYCEYLGKYFCHCCHSYAEACIPARILTSWDFRKYQVSNFSKRLLDIIWHQPVINLLNVGHSLLGKVKELDRVKEIQEQLFHIKKLLKTCRFAESTLQVFKQVPSHLTDEYHIFSLDDLVKIKKGLLVSSLKYVLRTSLAHVARCELCQGKGFICEFCQNPSVIFPFQTATCRRCSACKACFHKECFRSSQCPRCARNTARRSLLENLPAATT